MKINKNTATRYYLAISSSRLLLVPYDAHHVPTYHEWMSDPAIQEATASEPLTLEEEYENQISWRVSGDKLTFILCLNNNSSNNDGDKNDHDGQGKTTPTQQQSSSSVVKAGQVDVPEKMIGDINLFLTPWDEEEDDDNEDNTNTPPRETRASYVNGEIDIMIASTSHRGRGLGSEAVSTLLTYIRQHVDDILAEYGTTTTSTTTTMDNTTEPQPQPREQRPLVLKDLVAKINAGNQGSIALFKRLGFQQRGEVNFFGEVQLVLGDFVEGGRRQVEKNDDEQKWRRDGERYEEMAWDRSALE